MKLTKEQKQEIKDQQSQITETKRVTSIELEKILYEALPVLDHGFVRVIDYMGDDSSIVQFQLLMHSQNPKKKILKFLTTLFHLMYCILQ